MKVSCRKAFTQELSAQAEMNPAIYAIATDSRGSVTLNDFAERLPDQFLELGIAEQNAVSVACGLAATGCNVFVCGPACFLSARSYEQIKVDVAYNNTNVKIVGVSAGVSYGPLGGTHITLNDFAGMRSLPNIQVMAPCDDVQARALTQYLAQYEGPAYMRMGRGVVEAVYKDGETFEPGKAKLLREGKDITIIACGEMVCVAEQAASLLRDRGIGGRVLDMFTLKPYDEDALIRAAKETGYIITVEEHGVNGGLGELVCRVVAENHPCPVRVIAFPDEEYMVGSGKDLFKHYGFTADNIAAHAADMLGV